MATGRRWSRLIPAFDPNRLEAPSAATTNLARTVRDDPFSPRIAPTTLPPSVSGAVTSTPCSNVAPASTACFASRLSKSNRVRTTPTAGKSRSFGHA